MLKHSLTRRRFSHGAAAAFGGIAVVKSRARAEESQFQYKYAATFRSIIRSTFG
jgi:hypothetical protein